MSEDRNNQAGVASVTGAAAVKGAVLVTGAGRRIGRAIALHLATEGHAVAVHYHGSDAEARGVVAEARAMGGRAVALSADLEDERQVKTLIARAAEALGPVTALVNNAAVFDHDSFATATKASWDKHMAVNLRAPFVLAQAFAAQLPDDRHGNIINMIDQRVWRLTAGFATYTLSKSALWTLTRTMAMALAPRIRVNAIGPGPVLPSPRQTPAHFAAQVASLPLRRATGLDEIAGAVSFILATPSLTGQMIALDGGQHLGGQHLGDPAPNEPNAPSEIE